MRSRGLCPSAGNKVDHEHWCLDLDAESSKATATVTMSVAVTKNKQQVSLAIACLSATWRVELVSFVEFAARVARSQGLVLALAREHRICSRSPLDNRAQLVVVR